MKILTDLSVFTKSRWCPQAQILLVEKDFGSHWCCTKGFSKDANNHMKGYPKAIVNLYKKKFTENCLSHDFSESI
jgi:hypothetical protein